MVGNFDFNENPVVSLDLDLNFGLRLRVCHFNNVMRLKLSLVFLRSGSDLLWVQMSVGRSVGLSVCLSVGRSVCLSVSLSVCLSVCRKK